MKANVARGKSSTKVGACGDVERKATTANARIRGYLYTIVTS